MTDVPVESLPIAIGSACRISSGSSGAGTSVLLVPLGNLQVFMVVPGGDGSLCDTAASG